VGGYIFDVCGNYKDAFIIGMLAMLAATLLVVMVKREAPRRKEV